MKLLKIIKIIFACWGIALGVGILSLVLGMFIFGHEKVDHLIDNYAGMILLSIAVIASPIVIKYIK